MTNASPLRRLVIMRHAQAASIADDDRSRPLTSRGARDAQAAGAWLMENDVQVDHALVSTAVRTRETWAGVREGSGSVLEPDMRVELYTAGPETALDELRLCPEESTTALLVGHNPTVAFLSSLLEDGQGDPLAQARLSQGFPPATLVVVEFRGPWSELAFGECRLLAVHTARA